MWWAIAAGTGLFLVVSATVAVTLRVGAMRPRVISALADALNCDVSLDRIEIQWGLRIRVAGDHLTIRLRDRPELPPYIEVSRFTTQLSLWSAFRRHVDTVQLEGLQINVPKRFNRDDMGTTLDALGHAMPRARRPLFSAGHIVAHDAALTFIAIRPHNQPLHFVIHDLDVVDAGVERAMQFTATMTNPYPAGRVATSGAFGPWNRDDPTQTPLAGTFNFPNGDLSSINGISGHTAATGMYTGQLTEIHASGTSTTPDFALDLGGRPVPLTMTFDATVDGTNGTTRLDRVNAQLVATPLTFTGLITNTPGPGFDVALLVDVKNGRIEDLLSLAINSPTPPLSGNVSMSAAFHLPPGPGRARQRLNVDGRFGAAGMHFSNTELQGQLRDLSQRAQGKDREEQISRVATSVSGQFSLKNGIITVPHVGFAVPGALVNLSGRYTVGSEAVAFMGTVRLQASLSEVVGGFKSIFIKPFNGRFSDNGRGTLLPIVITGTRQDPHVTVLKKPVNR